MRKLLACLLLTGPGAQAAWAQDPVQVAPEHYTVLLENDRVRVLEFRDQPGDKIPMQATRTTSPISSSRCSGGSASPMGGRWTPKRRPVRRAG